MKPELNPGDKIIASGLEPGKTGHGFMRPDVRIPCTFIRMVALVEVENQTENGEPLPPSLLIIDPDKVDVDEGQCEHCGGSGKR